MIYSFKGQGVLGVHKHTHVMNVMMDVSSRYCVTSTCTMSGSKMVFVLYRLVVME